MFELLFIRSYLYPKKKQLSVSLIGLLSILVISIVVWLLVLFMSITEGIEKRWLSKLTSLNAPIRITPKDKYFESYYYQIDSISLASNYSSKSIREKLLSFKSDPYNPDTDEQIPHFWPSKELSSTGEMIDPVKGVFDSIESLKNQFPFLTASDYEIAGAFLRLRLERNDPSTFSNDESFLSQVSYIASLPEVKTPLYDLIQAPHQQDVLHYLSMVTLTPKDERQDRPNLDKRAKNPPLLSILDNIDIESVKTKPLSWTLPLSAIQTRSTLRCFASFKEGKLLYLVLPTENKNSLDPMEEGTLTVTLQESYFSSKTHPKIVLTDPLILLDKEIILSACLDKSSLSRISHLEEAMISITGSIQGAEIKALFPFKNLDIEKCRALYHFMTPPRFPPPWVHFVKEQLVLPTDGILLPKQFRDNHVLLGDGGYFSFNLPTPMSTSEKRIKVSVCGFYDPGVISLGAKFILAPAPFVHSINESSKEQALDPLFSNGIQVWFKEFKETRLIKQAIEDEFKRRNIDSYWDIVPFTSYDFAKELITQFRSDRYLFTLIGLIILLVASSNIVSLFLLLVHDKKHEIGILLSLGAKKRSIATIFGASASILGIISSVIGLMLAFWTLNNLDSLVSLLSTLEGQTAFNPLFYGDSLPKEMSRSVGLLICILCPLFSLIAGLIPALVATRFKPSQILRSE